MEWQNPQALYLILPLTAVWLIVALMSDRRRALAREAFAARSMWSRIYPPVSPARFWIKLILREVAIVSGLVALAGPQFGVQYEQVVPRGSDLYVMIDVSRSMLADDVPPTRLGRAKADVSSLINRLEGERVGLIAFAGQAVVKCPLTVDYDSFRRALDELDTDSAPRGGTAIGDAIRKALEVFHLKADRDQAILLITDGDDQQSYPLEAAAIAAERHVTIFAVGLGDSEHGARIPRKGNDKSFTEYNDQQVWSKLDSNLLEQIALKTSGVYVPAGTRAYDLGELYTQHLHGRAGDDAASQQRIRRTERYQLFLAIALISLLVDLSIAAYPKTTPLTATESTIVRKPASPHSSQASVSQPVTMSLWAFVIGLLFAQNGLAIEPATEVREGLKLYSKGSYTEARDKFVSATEELEKQKSPTAAIAAFDEACALHRKGDIDQARESYLRAGLSSVRKIAISAHFNLGTMSAEEGKKLAGDQPESVPPDKRQQVLDQLANAVDAYRHCLELQSDHAPSRRNLELIRQWVKYYTDKWHELDRQKRRDESNLLQFLEFLTQAETALKESVGRLPPAAHTDAFAELKRVQQELTEEIPTLREKIARDLQPQASPGQASPPSNSNELEEGIKLLQNWADTAGEQMAAAATRLGEKDVIKATDNQQQAIEELERIWEAVIPFHPLLAKELADQTQIKQTLLPKSAEADHQSKDSVPDNDARLREDANDRSNQQTEQKPEQTEIVDLDFKKLEESQQKTLRRARTLSPKAQAELERLESAPPDKEPGSQAASPTADEQQPQAQNPEEAKAGLRKAIELAPAAVDEMEAAIKSLRQKNQPIAAEHAEEARRILEEIQQAQPKNDQQNQQKNNEQKKQDQQNQDQQKQNEQKQDPQSKDDQKPEEQKKDEPSKKEDQQKQQQKNQSQKQDQQQVSQDRVEAALRKVREREQEKHERDRKLKALFMGKVPVDKDW